MPKAVSETTRPIARRRPATPRPGFDPPPPEVSHELIAQRAFEKFLARGCSHGDDWKDWFEAEQELVFESREQL